MACNNTLSVADANRLIGALKELGHSAIRGVDGHVYMMGGGAFGQSVSRDVDDEYDSIMAELDEVYAAQEQSYDDDLEGEY